ncbi:MAG: hypothetical protein KDK24_03375 [Pseudooceanicola sp.]|nr:hypothetical protein [Pseudooceanicola sp.]
MTMTPARRDVLFEMLRRQNIAQVSLRRTIGEDRAARDAAEATAFLGKALRSWGPGSAAKAGGHDEFLGTVRP